MAKSIQKLQQPAEIQPKIIRVAAYARVSSGKDAMLHSLSAQVSYYSKFIQDHRGWEFAGIYADEAQTGTRDTRPEFQRLLTDCSTMGVVDAIKKLKEYNDAEPKIKNLMEDLKTMEENKINELKSFL